MEMTFKPIELRSPDISSLGERHVFITNERRVSLQCRRQRNTPLGYLEPNETKGSECFSLPICFWHWDSGLAVSLRDHGEQRHPVREYSVPMSGRSPRKTDRLGASAAAPGGPGGEAPEPGREHKEQGRHLGRGPSPRGQEWTWRGAVRRHADRFSVLISMEDRVHLPWHQRRTTVQHVH